MKNFLRSTFIFLSCVAISMMLLLLTQDTELIVGRKKIYLEKYSDKSFDVLVVGSSRAEHTFNPELYKGHERIFNGGEEGHGLPSNYLMIKVLVEKYHLHIRKLLLQIDEFSFNGERGFSRQFRDDFFVTDMDDPEVFDAFKKYRGTFFANTLKIFPQTASLIYSDFFKFSKRQVMSMRKWIPRLNKIYLSHVEQAGVNRGYKPLWPRMPVKSRIQHFTVEEDDLEYFEKLVKFCQSHHIELYLYRAPVLNCEMVKSIPFDNYITKFSASHNIPFYDFKCKYQLPDQYEDQTHSADGITPMLTADILQNMGLSHK